ncbi:Spindle pole body component [Mycena indigotica]|uniref:Spindle pole body component n=1 Tax=Mycena indigotica TaxID=2126181 RepID=A0A8H6S865_9AGAR|nr:Spindle pole body component [Mycena indigotica]KAF7294696.1 Spindle pole body component [Mycena indigotica]
MEPFTPRPRTGPRKKITLSAKEYTKAIVEITGTIASVRRNRLTTDDIDEEIAVNGHLSRESRAKSQEPSFLAETSFVRAPLNSRVSSVSALPPSAKGKGKQESLDHVSLEIQEALILEDMLYILMGIEGSYITYHPDYSPEDDDPLQGIRFVVSPALDSSLRDLVERILPLGTYYTAISSFVELRSHLDFGLVNHALCASIRDMLKDYQTLLSQLEHAFSTSPQFSLQKLWFYLHPTIHTLSLIYQLVLELGSADDPSADLDSSSSSSSDPDEDARNEALGLGGAKLKAMLSEMDKNGLDVAGGSGIAVKGGEVLAILYERMQNMSGDPTAKTVYGTLLRDAGAPYVAMLRMWIMSGRLVDPYEELLVKESKFINRGILEIDYTDEYWERRYTLRDGSTLSGPSKRRAGVPLPRTVGGRLPGGACVPPLLEGWKHKILLAGKYLNVIRECGIEIRRDSTHSVDENLTMDDEKFYAFIEDAYTHANRTLLELLLRDQQLMPRLASLKRYFFLSQSSFVTHMLDLAQTELRKLAKSASIVKLQSLLDLALNADPQGEDTVFKEDVKVTIATSGLYEWLLDVVNVSGVIGKEHEPETHYEEPKKDKDDKKPMNAIDAFALDYTVKFPLSLVISRKTILRYQLLFRFLFHLKHVEQSLSSMWMEQKTGPWRAVLPHHQELERWRLRVFLLRARMLSFVQQILAFATFEVLEPNWRALEGKLAKVTTVDQLLRDHVDFLDTCLKECMLTSSKLLGAYSRLIVTCSTFAAYSGSFSKSANHAVDASQTPDGDQLMAKRWVILGKFETHFNTWFESYLNRVQFYASSENVSLLPLVVRLNSVKVGI